MPSVQLTLREEEGVVVPTQAVQISQAVKSSTEYDMLLNEPDRIHQTVKRLGNQEGIEQCGDPNKAPDQACDRPVDKPQSQYFIKRIVAGPGDTISIRGGHVIRNGKREPDGYTRPCDGGSGCDLERPITIPPGYWFMMGDNRGQSDDSRFWGPVPTAWLIGPAFATYWPPDRIGGV